MFVCLSLILIDSVFRTGENYYPQVFLEEFKYVVKEKKMSEYITDNIEILSDSDRKNTDKIYKMCLVFVFGAFQVILGYS